MNVAHLAQRSLATGTGAAVTLSALGVPAAWPFVPKMYIHVTPEQAADGSYPFPGRTVLDDLRQALGFDPERVAADADTFFRRLGDLPDIDVTARAESANGWPGPSSA